MLSSEAPIRILHVALSYPPAEGLGGPTRVVHGDTLELARRGHEVSVLCTNRHDKRRKIAPGTFERTVDGVHVTYLSTHTFPALPGTVGPLLIPELKAWLTAHVPAFDLVHIHGYRTGIAYSSMNTAHKAGIPYVVQPHGTLSYLKYIDAWKWAIDFRHKRGLRSANALLAGSPKEALECQRLVGTTVPIKLIPNGLDLRSRQIPAPGKLRQQLDLAPDTPLITFLGRVNWIKGPDILVRAFSLCKTNAVLAIVGPDDGYLQIVKDLVRQLRLDDKVRFVGFWESDVMEVLVDSDIFVLTSRKDLFPVALVEACAAGVPSVVADTCEIAQIVRDKAALVCTLEETAVSRAIDQLLSDPVLASRLSAGAKELASSKFDLISVVDQLETIYAEILRLDACTG